MDENRIEDCFRAFNKLLKEQTLALINAQTNEERGAILNQSYEIGGE